MFKKTEHYIIFGAALSLALSIFIWISGDKSLGMYTGLWVPSILAVGIYLKLLK